MAANTPMVVSPAAQQEILQYTRRCYEMQGAYWNIREQLRTLDMAYQREVDFTEEQLKARRANRLGDPTKFQNITVPMVMPAVESAVTYQASVFLTGIPIFDWVAPPEQEDAALQFSAITEENSIRGAWVRQYMMCFKDMFKYNLGIKEICYGNEVSFAVETDPGLAQGRIGRPKEVIWRGNTITRWDPYNSIWDVRVPPAEVYRYGDFAGQTLLMSRIRLMTYLRELDGSPLNRDTVWSVGADVGISNSGVENYYIPSVNMSSLLNPIPLNHGTNWGMYGGLIPNNARLSDKNYKDMYEVTRLYARIVPQEFGIRVPDGNTPQIWKFVVVSHGVVVYAERMTNAHNYLPVLIAQPYEDGLGYQTKSLADNTRPFQEVGSALVNSAMAARRRAISDRGIYNPLLISASHINNDSPTAKIPMRPAGYNKKPDEAYYPIPFRDEQSGIAFQELGQLTAFQNTMNGQNQARQGQFVKGNKTQREYESVMANATGRDQTVSIVLEGQWFTPAKEMLKLNTIQYQQGISIYSPSQDRLVKIDPVQLRRSAVTFKITDGVAPTDKVINADDFAVSLQTIATSPQIGGAYNIAPMFSYLMKTRHVNLTPFEKSPEQQTYEQALAAWQQVAIEASKQEGGQIPPQPTPQQYGYDPAAKTKQTGNPTVQGSMKAANASIPQQSPANFSAYSNGATQ